MTKLIRTFGVATCILAASVVVAPAQVISMATGPQGTIAYNTGQAVAKVANDNGITVRTQPIGGFLPMVNSGELDFGFTNAVDVVFAFKGTGNYNREHPNLMHVGAMFPLTTGIMAPCDLKLQTIADLKAKAGDLRIASEYTSTSIITYYVSGALATGGIGYDDFGSRVPVASLIAGIDALGDGLVDVALVSLNAGAGQQASVKLQGRGGLCYISLDDSGEALASFQEFMPAASITPFAQNERSLGLEHYGANLIQLPWVLLTHKDVSEDLVYQVTKTIAENKDALKASFGLFNLFNPEKMAIEGVIPTHPGALKYFAEAGIAAGN
jgi:TRAP transporter TAXI family solute receptor